jgi:hypothetical protein
MLSKMMVAATCVIGCAALTIDTVGAKPKPGIIKGKTAQKRNIRLTLQRNSMKVKHFGIEAKCRDGSILVIQESGFLRSPMHNGKVRDRQIGSTDQVWIKAHINGHQVRGHLRVTDRVGKVKCNSGWVRFHARR